MEYIKKQMRCSRIGKSIVDQFYLDEDVNVPDAKADVKGIIQGEGFVRIEEVREAEAHVTVSGKLLYHILYAAVGDEPKLSVLEGKLPVEEIIYIEKKENQQIQIRPSRVEFSAALIHSRKVGIRAMIELEAVPEEIREEENTVDIEADAGEQLGLYKKKRNVNLLQMHTVKRDTYRVKEEFALPGAKESVREVLWTDITNQRLDIRIAPDELRLRGELLVFVLYIGENEKTEWVEQTVTYEGSVACHGIDERMYQHVYAMLEEPLIEVRMDEDGEPRRIGVEATLDLKIHIYEEDAFELLEDVYSLKEQCEIETQTAVYEELLLQNQSKCKVAERLVIPEMRTDVLQICHAAGTLQIDREAVTEEGLVVEGAIHVAFLYIKADDASPFACWQGMVPFSHIIEGQELSGDAIFDISSRVEQLSVNLAGGEEVEVKAVLTFDTFVRRPQALQVIKDVILSPRPMQEQEQMPGIVGYIAKEGDLLWDLAKKYLTTVDGIMEINQLEKEEIKPGDRLLIFKENISIL